MASDKDTELEVLSHHYSETFELLKTDVGKRDRLFLYILIVIFLLLLYMSAPGVMGDLLNNFIRTQTGDSSDTRLIDVSFMGTILVLGLLSLSHTYFQTVLHVERQYRYVYQLEKELSKRFNNKAFIREGEFYRSQRRIFSKWTKAIFWWLSPALFLIFIVAWLIFLWGSSGAPFVYQVVGTLISGSILTSLGLYLLALMKEK
jgi:hypothetical protein